MNVRRRPPNPSVKVANLQFSIPHKDEEPRNILERIVWEKQSEIKLAKERLPFEELKKKIYDLTPTKDFTGALLAQKIKPAVIAEIKKASPSKGIIREDFCPSDIALSYLEGGASCLSILTDRKFFQGGFEILSEVRNTVQIPLLCKDFILSPYQLYQARVSGADAVLLIASILTDQDLIYLQKVASSIGLTILVEVHNQMELERVMRIGTFPLVGINNRNLMTFETDVSITQKLAKRFFKDLQKQNILLVSESGIATRFDLDKVQQAGAQAVLVGESLMRETNIAYALRKLIGGENEKV